MSTRLFLCLGLILPMVSLARVDNPINLQDASQIHAEYYAQGISRGTLVFLSGDGDGASQGFDPSFAEKCRAFQAQGFDVIALQSIRWLRSLPHGLPGNDCLDVSKEIRKTIAPLLPEKNAKCLNLVGFSYGTTLATVAYLANPTPWCGLVTLSWCNQVNLEAFEPAHPLCGDRARVSGFIYDANSGSMTLERYTGDKPSLVIQGTDDQVCGFTPTNDYLVSTNGSLNRVPNQRLFRISVDGAGHDLASQPVTYPWLKAFAKFIEALEK